MTIDSEAIIGSLAAINGSLVAVSLAIVTVIPASTRMLQDWSREFEGQRLRRSFEIAYLALMASVLLLVVGALAGVVGLFWPSTGLAWALGGVTAGGILLLATGGTSFALTTFRLMR